MACSRIRSAGSIVSLTSASFLQLRNSLPELLDRYPMGPQMLPSTQMLALHTWMSPVRWEIVEKALQTIPSDLLILIDSCDASAALTQIKPDNSSRRIDFITACGSHNSSTPLPRHTYNNRLGGTFTDILINVLSQKAQTGEVFTVANLHFGVMQRMAEISLETKHAPSTPFYFSVGLIKGMQEPSVRLKVLGRKHEKGDGKNEAGEGDEEKHVEIEALDKGVGGMTLKQGPDAKKARKETAHA